MLNCIIVLLRFVDLIRSALHINSHFVSASLPVNPGRDHLTHGVDHLCGQVDQVQLRVFQDDCRVHSKL